MIRDELIADVTNGIREATGRTINRYDAKYIAKAALRAIESSGKYRVVPVELTEEMLIAAENVDALEWSLEAGEGLDGVSYDVVWEAMLAASPKVSL